MICAVSLASATHRNSADLFLPMYRFSFSSAGRCTNGTSSGHQNVNYTIPHTRTVLSSPPEASSRPSGENARMLTLLWFQPPLCPSRVPSSSPLPTLHSHTLLKRAPVASSCPSGENAAEFGLLSRPVCFRVRTRPPSATLHSRTNLSFVPPPEASTCPSGENATLRTQPSCPSNVRKSFPSSTSHNRTFWSAPPEARSRPSGENDTGHIYPSCPSRVHSGSPSSTRHIRTMLSSPPVASNRPSGENATPGTPSLLCFSVSNSSPSSTVQSRAVVSCPPVASNRPSGENTTLNT